MRVLAVLLLVLAACNATSPDLEPAKERARERAAATVAAAKEACRARGQEVFEFEDGDWVCGTEAKARRDAALRTWTERCTASGTQVYRGGIDGWFCANPTADAGKECRSGAECEGACLLADDNARRGTCAPRTVTVGCFAQIGDDGTRGTLCVD